MQTAGTVSDLDAPAVFLGLLREAKETRASDIHLQLDSAGLHVSFRLDGLLARIRSLPNPLGERCAGRIKYLSRLRTYQNAVPQDGRIPKSETGMPTDIRVSVYPTLNGEKIVLRLFESEPAPEGLHDLGLPQGQTDAINNFLRSPSGLLLLTGPAGSGKTTTIYACLCALQSADPGRHIITIEDPAEQVIPGVMQTEINEAMGLTFAKAAKHLLRQDPQVLAVGEIRDEETAQIVVRAALTGHLVISTIHAGSCAGVVDRLLMMCPDRYAISAALSLIVNQRLVRKICPGCNGTGCAPCAGSGYRGRIPVAEVLQVDGSIQAAIRSGTWVGGGNRQSLRDSGQALVERGLTSEKELRRVIGQNT